MVSCSISEQRFLCLYLYCACLCVLSVIFTECPVLPMAEHNIFLFFLGLQHAIVRSNCVDSVAADSQQAFKRIAKASKPFVSI